jgi:hypothetical protein
MTEQSRARFQEFGPAPDFECGHSNRLADVAMQIVVAISLSAAISAAAAFFSQAMR